MPPKNDLDCRGELLLKGLNKTIVVDYDDEADVLYMSFGKPAPYCRDDEQEYGIVVGVTLDGRLNGITIVDFKKRINNK